LPMNRSNRNLLGFRQLKFIRDTSWLVLLPACLACAGCGDPVVVKDEYQPPAVAAAAGRAEPDERSLHGRLQSSDKDVRMEAILEAGRTRDAGSVSLLVERLSDGYPEVRFAAGVALEKITGTSRGYRYWAGPAERDEAVARWRRWLSEDRQARCEIDGECRRDGS
jgi:HEAT repeat protein